MARKNRRPVSEEQCVEIRAALKNLHAESCGSSGGGGGNEGRLSIKDMFRPGYFARCDVCDTFPLIHREGGHFKGIKPPVDAFVGCSGIPPGHFVATRAAH